MKAITIMLLIPTLLLGQGKGKKFKLPEGIQSHQFAGTHVLVKVKKDFINLFDGQSSPALIKNLSASIAPLVPHKLQTKIKSSTAPRLRQSPVDIGLYYEIGFAGGNLESFINQLYATGYFDAVEPDYTAQLHYSPNDLSTGNQYYLNKIRAYEAWDITKGSSEIIIGIVDSGGDLDHPDLASQLYVNTNDLPDGLDNDNDGYIDNYRGWDMSMNDNNPMVDMSNHGSHVSGCATASTDNGVGVGLRTTMDFKNFQSHFSRCMFAPSIQKHVKQLKKYSNEKHIKRKLSAKI